MNGGNGDNLYFNSGRFGYSNRTPPKTPNDPGKVISWLRRMQLFLGSEGLEHTISSNPTCPVYVISCKDRDFFFSIHGEKLLADHQKAWGYLLEATCNTEIEEKLVACSCVPEVWEVIQGWSLPTSDSSGITFLSTAVIGGMAAISPAGVLDSSMAVEIDIGPTSPSSLYTSNIINNICHAISSVVSLIGSNAFVHLYDSDIISRICHATSSVNAIIGRNAFVYRHIIHTSAEDQSLGLEGCGTAGRTPRGTKKNRRSHRTHRWAPYPSVHDAEGSDIWPASVGRHVGLRGIAHANVVTVSGGGRGDSSRDQDDGGSKGVTWADQQTGDMPSGGHFFALQPALTAAYSPDYATVWVGDSASSVHGTGSGKFMYNKRHPLSAEAFLLIGDGRKLKVECFGSLDVVFHRKDYVRVTLENVAVVPGLAFDLTSFNSIQEKHDILMNRDGTWILDDRVHFVKLPAGNYIQATWVEHGANSPAMVPAVMRPGQQRGINNDDLHISLGHTNDAIARETAKQMGMKVTDTRGYCDRCGEAKAIRHAVPRKTKAKSGRPLQQVFIDPTGPYPLSRAPFVGKVPTWGGGAVMDATAAAVAPAAATVTGSGVFPAASPRGAEGAPASAAVVASTVTGSGVFPAGSARGAAGAPASAVVAAASAVATATAAAAAAAAIPPDGAREMAVAQSSVFPTPQVDWITARHNQYPETATTRRRPRTAGGFGFRLGDARNVRAHLGGGGAQGVCRTYSGWDV